VLVCAAVAEAGHEITFYPSFYPQEVAVRFTSPATGAALLRQNKIHAYAGGDPFAGGAAPAHVRFTESLRGFVVLSFPRAVGAFAGADARCAAGAAMLRALAGRAPFVAHPYPITPYHDDYVAHVDLVQKARDRVAGALPRVRATGAQRGLAAPIFVRTVKLKDFPWNGWLRVAVPGSPRAAWNPIAGFGDAPGRMVWAAVGDPALLLDPDSGRFIANRARPQSVTEVTEAPAPALNPATLKALGPGVAARTKVVYRVLLSNAHDGQRLSVADVVYPYAFVARWGAEGVGRDHDPEVARATALARAALVAVRVTGVAKEVKDLGDMQLMYDVPEVEVY